MKIPHELLGPAIAALATLYPGRTIAVIFQGDEVWAGIVGIDLDRDDWLIAPANIERMIAGKVA